jgi:hypothetical protein
MNSGVPQPITVFVLAFGLSAQDIVSATTKGL